MPDVGWAVLGVGAMDERVDVDALVVVVRGTVPAPAAEGCSDELGVEAEGGVVRKGVDVYGCEVGPPGGLAMEVGFALGDVVEVALV